jgi:hypothetical protein
MRQALPVPCDPEPRLAIQIVSGKLRLLLGFLCLLAVIIIVPGHIAARSALRNTVGFSAPSFASHPALAEWAESLTSFFEQRSLSAPSGRQFFANRRR